MPELNKGMLSVDEALENVLKGINKLNCEEISIGQAEGRVLGQDLISRLTQPPTDVSAMDGYAVKSADLKKAAATNPVTLTCIGVVPAGQYAAKELRNGTCMRIFTGSPIPSGTMTLSLS